MPAAGAPPCVGQRSEASGVQGRSPAGSARHQAAVQAAEMARQGMEPSQGSPASASSAMPRAGCGLPAEREHERQPRVYCFLFHSSYSARASGISG